MKGENLIGLEVHVQLRTETKLFCQCKTDFGAEPNTRVCPVCLGLPGSLPVINETAIVLALRAAAALDCAISSSSEFDRKHYFYPDLAKGFQITQQRRPLARGGKVALPDGVVTIARLHLEEDAAKLIHTKDHTLVDYNRSGLPLIEIVTEPCLVSPVQAKAFLESLRLGLLQAGVTDGKLEEGSFRCDVNVSTGGGEKTEIKNLNSFRGVARALAYEIERQNNLLRQGETVEALTLGWDEDRGKTLAMRRKGGGKDYCFCPEPDLPPLLASDNFLALAKENLPEMPWHKRARLVSQYDIADATAALLCRDPELVAYFEAVVAVGGGPRQSAALILGPLARLKKSEKGAAPDPRQLAELLRMETEGVVSHTAAKEMLALMYSNPGDALGILHDDVFRQRNDRLYLTELARLAIDANPKPTADYLAGKERALGSLMAAALKLSRGRANPGLLNKALIAELRKQIIY